MHLFSRLLLSFARLKQNNLFFQSILFVERFIHSFFESSLNRLQQWDFLVCCCQNVHVGKVIGITILWMPTAFQSLTQLRNTRCWRHFWLLFIVLFLKHLHHRQLVWKINWRPSHRFCLCDVSKQSSYHRESLATKLSLPTVKNFKHLNSIYKLWQLPESVKTSLRSRSIILCLFRMQIRCCLCLICFNFIAIRLFLNYEVMQTKVFQLDIMTFDANFSALMKRCFQTCFRGIRRIAVFAVNCPFILFAKPFENRDEFFMKRSATQEYLMSLFVCIADFERNFTFPWSQ